jgi:hypothetical protein
MLSFVALVLVLALTISVITVGITAPLWAIWTACKSTTLSGTARAVWVLALVLGWSLTAVAFCFSEASTDRYRKHVGCSSILLAVLVLANCFFGVNLKDLKPSNHKTTQQTSYVFRSVR